MNTERFDRLARRIPRYGDALLRVSPEQKDRTFDIRLTAGQPVSLCGREGVLFLREDGGLTRALTEDLRRVSSEELRDVFVQACAHSVFSHEHELQKGYISMGDSCRVGVCGTAVLENGRVKSVRDVTGLIFRIPREARGCADRLFLEGAGPERGVLLLGEPSSGKTTLLRDIVLSLSAGKFSPCRRVAVLDERGEIGGGFDLGPCADLLLGYPKAAAFDTAIRMLSPQFVVCDELSPEDLGVVRQSVFSGVPLIASVHGTAEDLRRRPLCRQLLRTGAFGTVVCLAGRDRPGEIEAIQSAGGEEDEAAGSAFRDPQRALSGHE